MNDQSPSVLFDLTGRPSVVTGAAGRLGRAISTCLAAAGSPTWLVGRNAGPLDDLAHELREQGHDVVVHLCDVTRDTDVAGLMEAIDAAHGRLDVLVSNAHVGRGDTLETARAESYREACELALVATHLLINAGRPLMEQAAVDGSPSVIAIASMYGLVSPRPALYAGASSTNPPYYGAAKAGLIQLARYAAVELAPLGIRVNSLTPGPFPAESGTTIVGELARQVPMGRVGDPDELSTAVLYLASPRSRFTTGSDVVVDGGWTAW